MCASLLAGVGGSIALSFVKRIREGRRRGTAHGIGSFAVVDLQLSDDGW